jgi:hypothetical protein
MPELVIMKLGIYIMPPEAIAMVYFISRPINNTNTAAYQVVEVISLILLECLN